AAPLRVKHAHARADRRLGQQLDLPNPLAAIASVALEYPGTVFPQATRKFFAEGLWRSIYVRVGTPAEIPGPIKNLLYADPHDDVGVGADPNAASRHFAQHRI